MPALLSAVQAAAVLGVSERTFHTLRHQSWMPLPVVLGPRIVRWVRHELEQAATNMPRKQQPQPAQLLRGRIDAMKARGVAQ
jgi:predicted DNA-binding transcriptional regulator AlpA